MKLSISGSEFTFWVDDRSSHLTRTIESTVQVFTGLYPLGFRHATPNFHLRLPNHENLYPNEDFCAYCLPPSSSQKSAEETYEGILLESGQRMGRKIINLVPSDEKIYP